jgi:tRNA A37 threonylcarbamoyladenosine synthetase subunit TsaC/SUA5/YrdC
MLRAIRLRVVRHTTIMALATAARERILTTSAWSGPR